MTDLTKLYAPFQPMRIQARPGSEAEKTYYESASLPGLKWSPPKSSTHRDLWSSAAKRGAIARGIAPDPLEDLMFHGGKVVPQMEFQNVFLGQPSSWISDDINSINSAITLAMQDRRLNNVISQYFPNPKLVCDPRPFFIHGEPAQQVIDEPDVQAIVTRLLGAGKTGSESDLGTTIFNLILPRGTILKLGSSSSLKGLGGYHGSVHVKKGARTLTLYYSANVFSEVGPDGKENGIAAFNKPWKNVVGTLYHEMNEFRTDADVNDAIHKNSNDFLGWTSRSGREIGDQPIFVASNLNQVFKEVAATQNAKKKIPVQLMFSNAVHGAEGPIEKPHA